MLYVDAGSVAGLFRRLIGADARVALIATERGT
ncbi:hypothetical protein ACVWZ6_002513 [Bradyrhizobium sp. GM6.1]